MCRFPNPPCPGSRSLSAPLSRSLAEAVPSIFALSARPLSFVPLLCCCPKALSPPWLHDAALPVPKPLGLLGRGNCLCSAPHGYPPGACCCVGGLVEPLLMRTCAADSEAPLVRISLGLTQIHLRTPVAFQNSRIFHEMTCLQPHSHRSWAGDGCRGQ